MPMLTVTVKRLDPTVELPSYAYEAMPVSIFAPTRASIYRPFRAC